MTVISTPPSGPVAPGPCLAKRRRPSEVSGVDSCEVSLGALPNNSPSLKTVLDGLRTKCFKVETPAVPEYLSVVRKHLKDNHRLNSQRIEAYIGREFYSALMHPGGLDLERKIAIDYVGNSGWDVGGLTRQFITSVVGTIKDSLFVPIELQAGDHGFDVVQRYHIARPDEKSDEEILNDERIAGATNVTIEDVYMTAGKMIGYAVLYGINADLPLSRCLLNMMLSDFVVGPMNPDNALLYYLLDTDSPISRSLRGLEGIDLDEMIDFENDLQATADQTYAVNDRVTAFLEGFSVVGRELSSIFVNPNELLSMLYTAEITEDEFRRFLEDPAKVSWLDEYTQWAPLSESDKRICIDIFMGVKDQNYRQLLLWWTGQTNINNNVVYMIKLNSTGIPVAHTCSYMIELPHTFVQTPQPEETRRLIENFQREFIFQTDFSIV